MKTITTLAILSLVALATAQDEAAGPSLVPGGEVKLEPVTKAAWIQGAAPEKWEDGKVYIFECWATWCGPCIAAIPHVNALHKKYGEKGLRISGMNVWEDGQEKVAEFVKDKGDGMSYPVAYTGKGSDFENQWLKAAGVRGIPHAFVVKGGKYLFGTHPMNLDEETIEALLAGGEAEAKAVEKINTAAANREAIGNLIQGFRTAMGAKDAEGMAKAIAGIEKLDPESIYLVQMRLDMAMTQEDWAAATTLIEGIAALPRGSLLLNSVAYRLLSAEEEIPVEFRKAVAVEFGKALEQDSESAARPTTYITLACLRQSIGDGDGAKAAAKAAIKNHGTMPVEPFERYAKALEDGQSPTLSEVFGWVREAMSASGQQ